MIRLSWVVFVHAIILSIESIVIEILTTQLDLSPLAIAGGSIMLAGAALLGLSAVTEKTKIISIFRSWKILLPASLLFAVGVYTWYDSVMNVGASKEGLLAGPVEVIVILVLARAVLKERLGRAKTAGVVIALLGFFATVMSAGSLELLLTWGDLEAVISAISFGGGIILISGLTRSHSSLQVTGASLFISGLILASILWTTVPVISPTDWAVILAFSVLPLLAGYSYVIGLSRIGASLTSTIASFSILVTVLFQLLLTLFGLDPILPANIPLAIVGGGLGIFGIYLIHRRGS